MRTLRNWSNKLQTISVPKRFRQLVFMIFALLGNNCWNKQIKKRTQLGLSFTFNVLYYLQKTDCVNIWEFKKALPENYMVFINYIGALRAHFHILDIFRQLKPL